MWRWNVKYTRTCSTRKFSSECLCTCGQHAYFRLYLILRIFNVHCQYLNWHQIVMWFCILLLLCFHINWFSKIETSSFHVVCLHHLTTPHVARRPFHTWSIECTCILSSAIATHFSPKVFMPHIHVHLCALLLLHYYFDSLTSVCDWYTISSVHVPYSGKFSPVKTIMYWLERFANKIFVDCWLAKLIHTCTQSQHVSCISWRCGDERQWEQRYICLQTIVWGYHVYKQVWSTTVATRVKKFLYKNLSM